MNITESSRWEDNIYLIARADKVEGGRDGIANIQAAQLANRTLWLLEGLNELKEITYSDLKTFSLLSEGLAGTADGEIFRISQGMDSDLSFIFYENENGVAKALTAWPGIGYINKIAGLVEENDGDALAVLVDGDGFVVLEVKARDDLIVLDGVESVDLASGALRGSENALLSVEDGDGFQVFEVSEDGDGDVSTKTQALEMDGTKITPVDGAMLRFADGDGFELDIEDELNSSAPAAQSVQGDLEISALADSSLRHIPYDHGTARIRKGLNIVIVYGQSFSPGAQAYTALTTTESPRGNLMLGLSPRGTYFTRTTDTSFGVTGGEAAYHPLREVRQLEDGTLVSDSYASETGWGETVLSGVLETLKHNHNRDAGVKNDTEVIFAGSCTGAAGTTIAQLSKGSADGWFGRFTDCIDQHLIAAARQGFESVQVVAVVYMQGQNDAGSGGMTHNAYQAALTKMKADTVAEVMARTGQDCEPVFCITQTGGVYISSGQNNTLPVATAQLDVAMSVQGAIFAGVEFPYPNPGAHMYANGYRWHGCSIGSVVYPVISGRKGGTFRITDAVYDGEKMLIALNTPVPPLKISPFYVQNKEKINSDMGFTVVHGGGVLYGGNLAVSFLSPYIVQIIPGEALTGNIRLNLGDHLHNGGHNISDSDGQSAVFSWDYTGTNGQKSAENIVELINKKYSLNKRPASQTINVRTV